MQHARAVVVGGGAVGLSVLYHLCKRGWTDSILLEKGELTSGATWRAAGHVILYTQNPTVLALNQYGVELYRKLPAETGQDVGFHVCGNLRLATDRERLLEFERFMGLAEVAGVTTQMLSPAEVKSLWPLLEQDGVYGGLYNPTDGHISPADLAQSFAAGARQMGGKILRHCEMSGFRRTANGNWLVSSALGDIECEHLVLCTGLHTKKTLDLIGVDAHAIPIRHQYLLTEPVPELVERKEKGLPELPVMRDPEQSFYVRQEGVSLLFGAYERDAQTLFPHRVPDGFTQEGFPGDLDVLLPYLEVAMQRVPVLEQVGIQTLVPGVKPYSPDDLPITGPVPGHDRLWLAEGNPFGITLAGGIGSQLTEWIVEGEPSIDLSELDPRRFGDFATRPYVAVKTQEAYERTYLVPKPDEELAAGRPLRTSPIHDLLQSRGAVFGCQFGWEVPNWFSTGEVPEPETYSYAKSSYFDHLRDECDTLKSGAGVSDATSSGRFRMSGDEAEGALARFFASPLPERVGDIATCIALTMHGKLRSVLRVVRETPTSFLLIGDPRSEGCDADDLARAATGHGARLDRLTGHLTGLRLEGDRAEAVLRRALYEENATLTPGTCERATVGLAPAIILRDADGFEVMAKAEYLRHVLLHIFERGGPELRLCGSRARQSRRLEGGRLAWGVDVGIGQSPSLAGLDVCRAVQGDAPVPMMALIDLGARDTFLPCGGEPVRSQGRLVGTTTSGGYGHTTGRALAIVRMDATTALPDTEIQVRLFGRWHDAAVLRPARL